MRLIQFIIVTLLSLPAMLIADGLLEQEITEALSEKITDKRIAIELKFNSSSKISDLEGRASEIGKIEVEKFDQKYSSFRVKLTFNDGRQDSISGKYISFVDVPVAANFIKYNGIIGASDLTTTRVRVDHLKRGFATEANEVIGMKVRKYIPAGSMFRLSDLVNPPVIKNGDPVNLVYNSGIIKLKTSGTALGSGAVGDSIKVKNDSSGAVILGEIINKNTVRVGGE